MEDNTIEYMPMFLNQNNRYKLNYQYNQNTTGGYFKVNGVLPNVDDVYKLYKVNASKGESSWVTTIAAKKDGSFYDLRDIINNNSTESTEEKTTDENNNRRYYLLDGVNNKRRYYLAFDEEKMVEKY